MSAQLDALTAAVLSLQTTVDQAVSTIADMKAQIAAQIPPGQVQTAADQIMAAVGKLQGSLVDGTPTG